MKEKLYRLTTHIWWQVNYDYSERDADGDWRTVTACDRFKSQIDANRGYQKRCNWMFDSYHVGDFITGNVYMPVKKEQIGYIEVSEEEVREILGDK